MTKGMFGSKGMKRNGEAKSLPIPLAPKQNLKWNFFYHTCSPLFAALAT